jgi:hypothetical protein
MSFDFFDYRLRFTAPLAVGETFRDSAARLPMLHSDLLANALASAWRELHGSDAEWPLPGTPEAPAITISSALPYTDELGPLAPLANSSGGPPVIVRRDAPGDGPIPPWPDATPPWTVAARARAEFSRFSARRTQRFTAGEIRFAPAAGLWLGVRFADADADRAAFEAALRYLGDCGIGGRRSVGAGRFDVDAVGEVSVPAAGDDAAVWCLSVYRPSDAEFAGGSLVAPPASPIWVSRRLRTAADGVQELTLLGEGSCLVATADLRSAGGAGTVYRFDEPVGSTSRPRHKVGRLFALPAPVPAGVANG